MSALISLPEPPTAEELDLVWWAQNKATTAAYMAAIYALTRAQYVVVKDGVRLPAVSVQIAGPSATIEITV